MKRNLPTSDPLNRNLNLNLNPPRACVPAAGIKSKIKSKIKSLGLIVFCAFLATATLHANTHIWTGAGLSAYWSDTHNWDSGNLPVAGEPAPVVLRFPAVALQTFNTNDIVGLSIDSLLMDRAGYVIDLGGARLLDSITMASPFPGQSRLYGSPVLGAAVTTTIGADLELVAFAQIGDTGVGGGFAKFGAGTLTLSGKNSFKGLVRIEEGFVEVTHNSGLGEQDAGVTTGLSGALVLRDVTIKGESLALAYGGPSGVGTLIAHGTNEWIGPVDVVRDASITAVTATDEVKLSGVLGGSAQLELRGPGRVILAGEEPNTHDGTVVISNGELRLAKFSPSVFPVEALNGPLFIGSPAGFPLALLRHAADEQIFDKVDVTLRASGRIEMDNHRETIQALNFEEGGNVNSGSNGRLTLGDDVSAITTSNAQAHVIGNMSLGGSTRKFTVGKSFTLFIDAAVEDGGSLAGIAKYGDGTLVLGGANTFTGPVTAAEGILAAAHAQALGAISAGTEVLDGASLALNGSVTIAGEALTLNGLGFGVAGALYGELLDTWTGPITLASNSRISCPAGCSLHLSGIISGPGALQKSGPDRLFLEGTQGNTYAGTLVSAGALMLNKTSGLAVPGALTISDGSTNASVRPLLAEQVADATVVAINALGTLEMPSGSYETVAGLSGSGSVAFDQGTLVVGALNTGSTFQGQCTGTGNTNIIKIGTGSFQFLNNVNTHSGQTVVRAGQLRMDGTQLSSLIVVEDGAVLAGHGTCGPVQVLTRGKLAPQSLGSPGLLTVGSIPFSPAAEFYVDLAGTTPNTGYDQLRVNGAQNLNNARLLVNYTFVGTVGDTFLILDNQGASPINGTFAGLPQGAVFTTNGQAFRISYQAGTGNDVALTLLASPSQAHIDQIDYIAGQAKLLASGSIGFTYYIEANDDLNYPANWVNIGQAMVGGAGTMAFADMDAGNYQHRFYRFRTP